MNSLVTFPIELGRTASALEGIHQELNRIGSILERMAPAIPESHPSRPAGLQDLHHTDYSSVSVVRRELDRFAQNNDVLVDSDAFIKAIIEFEEQVEIGYGPGSIEELPWNKAHGSALFQQAHEARERAKQEASDAEAARVPKPQPASSASTQTRK
jgi:hypothetical protein